MEDSEEVKRPCNDMLTKSDIRAGQAMSRPTESNVVMSQKVYLKPATLRKLSSSFFYM